MATNVTLERWLRGVVNLSHFFGRAFPPDLSNLDVLAWSMFETLNIAIVGVTIGVILSLPFALLSARNTTASWVRTLTRFIVSTMRTIPDLIWALIFVVAVGLGPMAGVLAIIMDTIGFAARFFSERIESPPGPF